MEKKRISQIVISSLHPRDASLVLQMQISKCNISNRLRINQMIILIDAEKTFDKVPYNKNSEKLRIW